MTFPYAKPPDQMLRIEPRTEAVVKMWEKANNHERSVIGQMQLHYEHEVRDMVQRGEAMHNIAHTVHTLVDDSVRHTRKTHPMGRKVKCSRGCAACCHLHVTITEADAQLLLVASADAGITIDWGQVQRQAAWNLSQWSDQTRVDRRCVFLGKDDTCRVYEHRPTVCRKYMVITDPKLCDTVRHPGADVGVLVPIDGEVIYSAVLGVMDAGSMPKMLLAAREAMTP